MNRHNSKTYWDTFPLGRKDGSFEEELLYRNRLDYIFSEFVDTLDLENKRILDLGCGQGIWSYYMLSKGAKEVIGIDISEVSINNACKKQEMMRIDAKRMKFILYDGLGIPFKDNSFDVVHSDGVIHHAEDDRMFLKESYRVLREGGGFAGCVYNKISPGFVARGCLRKLKFMSIYCRPGQGSTFLPEILLCPISRHYTVSEWRNYLNESGYKQCRVFPDYSGIGRFWPWLGKYFDKITMGKLGYYLFWKSIK